MKPAIEREFFIEKLRTEHDLSSFDCGNPTLTTWLKKFAWTNQQADSAKTYVACQKKSCGRILFADNGLGPQT